MKIILKENIKGIGRKYEIKSVADGYANNFLIPKKLAEYASPEAIKKAEILKSNINAELEIREKFSESLVNEEISSIKKSIGFADNEELKIFLRDFVIGKNNKYKISEPNFNHTEILNVIKNALQKCLFVFVDCNISSIYFYSDICKN